MVRKLDELGRIVIPIEIRRKLDFKHNDEIEIKEVGNEVILQKYEDICCPNCSEKCRHTDNYCKNCGYSLKTGVKDEL